MRAMRVRAAVVVVTLASALLHPAWAVLHRPAWMDDEGIVMAGSWEAPAFRARGAGRMDFKLPPESLGGYQREHSQEMIDELKALGVNFIMTHGYKGYGFNVEREGMDDARRFADLIHKSGVRVGAYIGSTLGWESLFQEVPEAKSWMWLDPNGQPAYYSGTQQHRYVAMKNNAGYIAYIQRAVRFAVEEMHADLIHFDNTSQVATGWDPTSVAQFREFLQGRGFPGAPQAVPPVTQAAADPQLWRYWVEYRCEALAHYQAEMTRFIRSLNPQCAVECNPGGMGSGRYNNGVDHARLLELVNAYWDESSGAGWTEKGPRTRILSLKLGQAFRNSTFLYTESALDAAEMLAFNANCLGCVAWFQDGKIVSGHGGRVEGFREHLAPYVEFFHEYRSLLRDARPVADVAVLRDFQTMAFGPSEVKSRILSIEQKLIEERVPFAIIFDQQREQFKRYPAIIAAPGYDLGDYKGRIIRADAPDIEKLLPTLARLAIEAPPGVVVELAEGEYSGKLLLHLVNYNVAKPAGDIKVSIRPKKGRSGNVRLYAPGRPPAPVKRVVTFGRNMAFTVPDLNVYRLVVIG